MFEACKIFPSSPRLCNHNHRVLALCRNAEYVRKSQWKFITRGVKRKRSAMGDITSRRIAFRSSLVGFPRGKLNLGAEGFTIARDTTCRSRDIERRTMERVFQSGGSSREREKLMWRWCRVFCDRSFRDEAAMKRRRRVQRRIFILPF